MWPFFYWFSFRLTINITFSFINNHLPHQQFVKNFVKKFVFLALLFFQFLRKTLSMKSFWENDCFIKMSNGFYGKIVLNVNPWVFSFITLWKIFSSNFMVVFFFFLGEKAVFINVKISGFEKENVSMQNLFWRHIIWIN